MSGTGYSDSGIQEIFACGILDPGNFWLVKSGILDFGIWNSAPGIRNLSFTDKECGLQYLESGIHSVQSSIHDCLELANMGQD